MSWEGSSFALTIGAGETRQLTVQCANQYDQPLKLRSFVFDTFTLINGGLGVRDGAQNTEVPASWIAYPTDVYSLKPTGDREISFKVTVSKDAKPGKPCRSARVADGGCGVVRGTAVVDQNFRNVPSLSVDIANT